MAKKNKQTEAIIKKVETELENLSYKDNCLQFKIVDYITEKVLYKKPNFFTRIFLFAETEYIENSYKVVKYIFKHRISLIDFCEKKLLHLEIPDKCKIQIYDYLKYSPRWLKNARTKYQIENSIAEIKKSLIPLYDYQVDLDEIAEYYDKKISDIYDKINKIIVHPTSRKSKSMRVLLTIPTLSLCWIGYLSKSKARKNSRKVKFYEEEIKRLKEAKKSTMKVKKQQFENEELLAETLNETKKREIYELEQKLAHL